MTLFEAVKQGEIKLKEAGIEDAQLDARSLLFYLLDTDMKEYLMRRDEELTPEKSEDYRLLLEKRSEHVPIQYIMGKCEFMGLELTVNSNVLIPRLDTEILVTSALEELSEKDVVLDLCTGSGCVLLSLMKNADISGYGADKSKQALLVARENAIKNHISASWICSDMFEKITGIYDMIVCNPPYIPTSDISDLMPEVRDFEPQAALDGGGDGLDFYRILAKESPNYLKRGGKILCEIGYDQASCVIALFKENGFDNISVIRDLSGHDRVVKAVMVGDKYV